MLKQHFSAMFTKLINSGDANTDRSPRLLAWLPLLALLMFSHALQSHPMAPGLLSIHQQEAELYRISWKLPLQQKGQPPVPSLPRQCKTQGSIDQQIVGTGRVMTWRSHCPGSLVGESIGVEQLSSSGSGVLLRLQLLNGMNFHQMLSAEQNLFEVPAKKNSWEVAGSYTWLGVEHLVGGIDHVLFIIGLFLLVGWNRQLFWTVTLFTLGHSVTLTLAALGFVHFPINITEAIIALSIVITAAEWIRNDPNSAFRRHPWAMSGGFGLLHGMGFASVLADIGLPQSDIPLALASFNIGIELGQLGIIVLCYGLTRLINSLRSEWPRWMRLLPGYGIGVIASLWFWERLGIF